MKILEYLKTANFLQNQELALSQLKTEYGVRSKKHPEFPIWTLCYDQVDSPRGNSMVDECRGLIIDKDLNIIARPFKRFYSYGEGHAADIDWQHAKVMEKVDGSLIIVYYYNNAWQIASKGTPDASGLVGTTNKTLAQLFSEELMRLDLNLNTLPHPGKITYLFEYCSLDNRVVIVYKDPQIYFLDAIENKTGESTIHSTEIPWKVYALQPVNQTKQTLETAQQMANLRDGSKMEGVVVVDTSGNRIKIKNPKYVVLHHMKSKIGSSENNLIDLALANESSEFLSYFPELETEFEIINNKLAVLKKNISDAFEQYKHIQDQKEFALAIKHLPFSSILFNMRKGSSLNELIIKTKTETIRNWL